MTNELFITLQWVVAIVAIIVGFFWFRHKLFSMPITGTREEIEKRYSNNESRFLSSPIYSDMTTNIYHNSEDN